MGTASAEGFGPALCGVDVEDFVEDIDVGDKNSQGRNEGIERTAD